MEKPTSDFRKALANHNYIFTIYNKLLKIIEESKKDEKKKNKERFDKWYAQEKEKIKEGLERERDWEFKSEMDLDKIMTQYQNKINNYFIRHAKKSGFEINNVTLDTTVEKVFETYKPMVFGIRMKIEDNV